MATAAVVAKCGTWDSHGTFPAIYPIARHFSEAGLIFEKINLPFLAHLRELADKSLVWEGGPKNQRASLRAYGTQPTVTLPSPAAAQPVFPLCFPLAFPRFLIPGGVLAFPRLDSFPPFQLQEYQLQL